MGNIFDNMRDESQDDSNNDAPNGAGTFTVQFGTESVIATLRAGQSLRDAFVINADFLGFDSDRLLTYRDNRNNILDGHEVPEAGVVYTASITHDEKG